MEPTTARHLLAATARVQREGRLPSLVAGVVADGSLAWSAGRGRVRDEVPDAVTSYAVGSITKTFTATLVMRLRDEGLLRLDDPVGRHLRDVDLQERSVGQLLAQTTGLRAEPPGPWWERVDGPEWIDLAAAVAADDLLQPAGRRFHYSNLGYALLGRLVEVLRGASWGACLDREILRPLGMDATTVGAPQVHAPGLAVHPWADLVLSEPAPDYRAMAPAGALWSTIADLAVWARFLLGETGEVLDPGTLDEMLEPGGADADVTGASAYGLGVQVHQVDGRTLVGHGGSVPGHVAGVLVDRAERTAAMAVANATQGDLGELLPRLLAIVREREPLVVDEWRPTAGATAAPPLDVTGVWYWGATPIAVRAVGNGGLHLEALGGRGRTSRFAPTGKDLWRGRDGYYAGEELRALRDTDGGITHLDVATFVLTRAPYEGDAVPGGAAGGAWRDAPGDAG